MRESIFKKIEYLYEIITSLTWLRLLWILWMCFAAPGGFIYDRLLKITDRKARPAYELTAIVVFSTLFYAGVVISILTVLNQANDY